MEDIISAILYHTTLFRSIFLEYDAEKGISDDTCRVGMFLLTSLMLRILSTEVYAVIILNSYIDSEIRNFTTCCMCLFLCLANVGDTF